MIEPGQVWEYCGEMTVLIVAPRPDLDAMYARQEGTYWDVVYLRNASSFHDGDEGVLDWLGIEITASNWWERLS